MGSGKPRGSQAARKLRVKKRADRAALMFALKMQALYRARRVIPDQELGGFVDLAAGRCHEK